MSQRGIGEFVVNVREWLSDQLRGTFRDQYAVSLVGGGEEGETNHREVGMTAMAGVMRTIHRCGLTRNDADKLHAEAAELVYGDDEGTTTQAQRAGSRVEGGHRAQVEITNAMATSPRRTPPRRTKSAGQEPRRARGWGMEALVKGVSGLLVRCEPTGEKLIANKTLGHTMWCCNGACSV